MSILSNSRASVVFVLTILVVGAGMDCKARAASDEGNPASSHHGESVASAASLKATFTVFPEQVLGEIDRNVYGHFVEHVGRVVYGGIWAEMIENRSFEGRDYDGNGLPDPWESVVGANGPKGGVTVSQSDVFRGKQSLLLDAETGSAGARQHNLGLRSAWTYDLEVWTKAAETSSSIQVRLEGPDGESLSSARLENLPKRWQRQTVSLKPSKDLDAASLSLEVLGEGRVWVDSVSLMPRENHDGGVRKDVVRLVREMKPPVIRYPGGCFADGYHWKGGVGPREKRPISGNATTTAAKSFIQRQRRFAPNRFPEMSDEEFVMRFEKNTWRPYEMNDFGTDEFMRFTHMVGAEPFITVNFGSGSPEEAADWVAYCNSPASDPRGAMRAANGHPEPYGVKYWGVGNEIMGPHEVGGAIPPREYGERFAQFAKAMRTVDPGIKLVAVGWAGLEFPFAQWNPVLLSTEAAQQMDYLSVHHYYGRQDFDTASPEDAAKAIMAAPVHLAKLLDQTRETLQEVGPDDRQISIVLEEWGTWHYGMVGLMRNAGRVPYTMVDGVFAAGVFHEMQRRGNSVTMGNMATLVNTIGSVRANHTGAFGTPYQKVFHLFANHCQSLALAVSGDAPTYDTVATARVPALKGVSLVDVAATRDDRSSQFVITALNRSLDAEADLKVELAGARASQAKVLELRSDALFATNTFETPDKIQSTGQTISLTDGRIEYRLAPHSLTIFMVSQP